MAGADAAAAVDRSTGHGCELRRCAATVVDYVPVWPRPSAYQESPEAIVADATDVHWSTQEGTVASCPIAGCSEAPRRIAWRPRPPPA